MVISHQDRYEDVQPTESIAKVRCRQFKTKRTLASDELISVLRTLLYLDGVGAILTQSRLYL